MGCCAAGLKTFAPTRRCVGSKPVSDDKETKESWRRHGIAQLRGALQPPAPPDVEPAPLPPDEDPAASSGPRSVGSDTQPAPRISDEICKARGAEGMCWLAPATGPLLMMNLGGEMMYIIDQRLRDQRIQGPKSRKVLEDLRVAHASIMKLPEASMDKLHCLMIMVFKYQVMHCVYLKDLIDITANHLDIIQRMVAGSSQLAASLGQCAERVHALYDTMDVAELCAVRQSLCTFFQDKKEKVSLLLEGGFQNRVNGSIIAPQTGCRPDASQPLGTVRYFKGGKVVRTDALPVLTAKSWKAGESFRTKLGQNIYSKVWSVQIRRDHERSSVAVSSENLPSYWTNKQTHKQECQTPSQQHFKTAFEQMVYAKRAHQFHFDEMLRRTYLPIATQDRMCPSRTCRVTPGGCACVRPGGNPGLPTGYTVRRVIRVENSGMWARYIATRDAIVRRRSGEDFWNFKPRVLTSSVAAAYPESFADLNEAYNEVYLWHGTPVRTALAIAGQQFDLGLAGSAHGSMYGQGIYLAESCTKADEYARDEHGYYNGVFALLLCRVCMGKFYRTTGPDEHAGHRVASGTFDSTCGDRSLSVKTYREFVIYDPDQLYPEFIVLYSRRLRHTPEELVRPSTPFYMELPVYWGNCYKDPRKQAFNDQFTLESSTLQMLQRFVQACSTEKTTIVTARRIENSMSWNRYLDFKTAFHRDMAWRNRKIATVDDVMTNSFLEQQSAEEAISFENLEGSLNEFLLWHGTTHTSAETIAADYFSLSGVHIAHGSRFGVGAYFAEDLDKSLAYTKGKDVLVRHVLLCRVCCGDVYYTDSFSDPLAHQKARARGKHCVLANPSGRGHREFVVLSEVQVYPEFLLGINAKFSL